MFPAKPGTSGITITTWKVMCYACTLYMCATNLELRSFLCRSNDPLNQSPRNVVFDRTVVGSIGDTSNRYEHQ
jgi:hypothetical protein